MTLLNADLELVLLSILISTSIPMSLTMLSKIESWPRSRRLGVFFSLISQKGVFLQHPVNTELDTADKGS